MMGALVSYPELGCTGGHTRFLVNGGIPDVLCGETTWLYSLLKMY